MSYRQHDGGHSSRNDPGCLTASPTLDLTWLQYFKNKLISRGGWLMRSPLYTNSIIYTLWDSDGQFEAVNSSNIITMTWLLTIKRDGYREKDKGRMNRVFFRSAASSYQGRVFSTADTKIYFNWKLKQMQRDNAGSASNSVSCILSVEYDWIFPLRWNLNISEQKLLEEWSTDYEIFHINFQRLST